ncbi:hypothetical protein [Streptomyces lincolnensis]|nr:hypothetical protein [Streptomyces lincolnensis]
MTGIQGFLKRRARVLVVGDHVTGPCAPRGRGRVIRPTRDVG